MHVVHSHNGKRVDEHTKKNVAFFITNKKGGYLSLGEANFTHMQGLHFFDESTWSPYKTVENIIIDKKMAGIRNSFASVERVYEEACEEVFTMFNNTMYYSVRNYVGDIIVDLDFRHTFDYDDQGRIYTIRQDGDMLIIRYDKYRDGSMDEIVRTKFLVIKGILDYQFLGSWEKKNYDYDARRGAKSEFYTYKAVAIPSRGILNLVFSFSNNLEEAKEQARLVHQNESYYLNSMKKYMHASFNTPELAMDVAMKALDDLLVSVESRDERGVLLKRTGVFAGLPWFFQFWSRDELISLKALMLAGRHTDVKKILLSYVDAVSEEGLVPNRLPNSEVKSIDAAGWLFVRIHDFLSELVAKQLVDKALTVDDVNKMRGALEKSIQGLSHYHANDGFIFGGLQESWMDTKEANRSGAFIESQAFLLAMMRLHNELAKATHTKQLFLYTEPEFASKVKAKFFKNGVLLDTVGGALPEAPARPNVFLAYYIYPDLLSSEEWKQVFDNTIKDLWLDWGGFATVSHLTPYFNLEYTGENDKSYHNGDSWYYVNNYAALAMLRLDKERYWKYINRIRHASREELLFSGFIGCSAELSSAKELRSEGCLSQAWSAASFVELENELKG